MKIANLAACVLGCVPFLLIACASATRSPEQVEVGAYGLEDSACVHNASTKADADACRSAVLKKYCALWEAADAGVASCAFADSGTEGGK